MRSSKKRPDDDDKLDILIKQRVNSIVDKVSSVTAAVAESDDAIDKYIQDLLARMNSSGNGSRKEEELKSERREIEEMITTTTVKEPSGEATQKYVRDLMRTCFQVEEEAAKIKGRYVGGGSVSKTSGLGVGDIFKTNGSSTTKPQPTSNFGNSKSLKTSTLSKPERLVLAAAS